MLIFFFSNDCIKEEKCIARQNFFISIYCETLKFISMYIHIHKKFENL